MSESLTSNQKLPLLEWVLERFENCCRIARQKEEPADRDSWMEDAEYFRQILVVLSGKQPSGRQPVETTPSMDVDTRGRRVQMNEECPDGHHDRGEYFCRRCGRSVVQLASPIQTPAPLNPGQCPNCNHLAKRNEELQKRIHNQRQEIGALLKGGSPESTARKATYRDIYPDDPTWWKEGMKGPWFELPSRLPENGTRDV